MCREVQAEVYSLIKDWTLEEHNYLREHVPKMGLRTPFRDGTLQDVALKVGFTLHAPVSGGFSRNSHVTIIQRLSETVVATAADELRGGSVCAVLSSAVVAAA